MWVLGDSLPRKLAMSTRRMSLSDCGEACFTALAGNTRPRLPPIPSPAGKNPELPGTTNADVRASQPPKAAMARRNPKSCSNCDRRCHGAVHNRHLRFGGPRPPFDSETP